MLTIKSAAVNASTFNFFVALEIVATGEYYVRWVYTAGQEIFRLQGELSGEELYGCLTAALEGFEEVIYFAEANKSHANAAYSNWLAKKETEELKAFRDSLEVAWIKDSLLLVSEEADDENEVYISTYTYNGLKVTKKFVGLDLEIKISVDDFVLANDTYSFEGGRWPSPEEYLINLLC